MAGTMGNLVLSVLGAGQLTLPYAMDQLGIALGLASLVLFTCLSMLSLHTLSVYLLYFKPGPRDCLDSYSELVVRVLGVAGTWICTALLAIYAWGGALSFMVILKTEFGFLAGLVPGLAHVQGSTLLVLVAACFIWPCSALEDCSKLKKFAPMGCIAAIFITIVVGICAPWGLSPPATEELCQGPGDDVVPGGHFDESVRLWPSSFLNVAAALPLLSFALNSSWAFIPILCTLSEKRPRRVGSLIGASNLVIFLNYLPLATNGYLMFCSKIQPNILDSLGEVTSPGTFAGGLVVLARAALATQLTLALPMRFFVARRTLSGSLGWGALERGTGRAALAGALVASATALAIMPLSLATVLGVVSSVCASMIIYILPAYVDLRLRLPGALRKAGSVLNLLVGLFILLGGLTANLLGVAVAGG